MLKPKLLWCICVLVSVAATAAEKDPLSPSIPADPQQVSTYLEKLADEQQGYYAAIKLAELGPVYMPLIIDAMGSPNPITRKWAARTITDMGKEQGASGKDAIVAALAKEKDPTVIWYMVQCVAVLKPDAAAATPVVVSVLEQQDVELKRMAAEALGELGPGAKAGKPALIKVLEVDNGWLQTTAIHSLLQIGMDSENIKAIATAKVQDGSDGAIEIFHQLLGHPDLAIRFVGDHSGLLAAMPRDDLHLIDLFARHEDRTTKLRQFLELRKDLPEFIRVDYAKGEKIGHVMTWPRNLDPTLCFPQRAQVVKVEPGRAVVDRFATDKAYKLWESDGMVSFSINGKWGAIDPTGKIIIEPKFDDIRRFTDGLAVVYVAGKYGYANKKGDYVVPPRYAWAYEFSGGLGAVREGDKWGLLDREGHWTKEPIYKRVDPWGEGFKAWTFDGMEGMLDAKANLVSPVKSQD